MVEWSKMKLNRRTDYALRAMAYLAVHAQNGPRSIAEVSSAEKTPREFTAKVLKELCRLGFIRSRLGPRGGYRLAKSPKEITVLEIMEALDGPLAINECLVEPSFCGRTPGCRMHTLFGKVNDKMKGILGSTTIADIAKGGNSLDNTDQRICPSDSADTGETSHSSPPASDGFRTIPHKQ